MSGTPDPQAARREARALASLLKYVDEEVEDERRDVRLGDDEPVLVKALWETLGYYSAFEERSDFLAPPEKAPGQATVLDLLRRYGVTATASMSEIQLPADYRFVGTDNAGVGLQITDESRGEPDPPVVCVLFDERSIEPTSSSYVRWCANGVVMAALKPWFSLFAQFDPSPAGLPQASRPFPVTSPATIRLTDDLWISPKDELSVVPPPDGEWCWMWGARWKDLYDGLRLLAPSTQVRLSALLPGDQRSVRHLSLDALLKRKMQLVTAFACFPNEGRAAVGTLEGIPLIVWESGSIGVSTEPGRGPEVDAALGTDGTS